MNIDYKNTLILFFLLIISCEYPKLTSDIIIYENNFENNNLDNIEGGLINSFNGTKVNGFYNKDGFNIHLNNLDSHQYISISFDLYIHGSWDGNKNGFKNNDKPDKWILEIRPDMNLHQNLDFQKWETTFSNSPCFSNWCRRQSYPNRYPFENNPYSGASKINLPRTCDGAWGGESALYKIEKIFKHNGNALVLRFYDELYQPNAIDSKGYSAELCDESWSIDNIKIRAINYE